MNLYQQESSVVKEQKKRKLSCMPDCSSIGVQELARLGEDDERPISRPPFFGDAVKTEGYHCVYIYTRLCRCVHVNA
ncbi:hypothetical protein V1477_001778 [Vespula maculifrons]|uniref:Uncharacterized protein n=1 Tax=Vespula maculifrons TaxID=7453 RepID=A0ABD2CX88_VESMC